MQKMMLAGLLALASGCTVPKRSFTIQLPDGQPIFVRSIGTGRDTVLVLHHGPGLHGGYLEPMLKPLAAGHTFLVYDQRGRGRSNPSVDTAQLSVQQDLSDLDAIRGYFRLARPTIMGHGWGAMLAALYALDHPDHVSRLMLVSPLFPRVVHAWGAVTYPYEMADSLALRGIDSARAAHLDTRDPVAFCREYWGGWLSPAAVRDRRTISALDAAMCDAPKEALARVDPVNRALLRSLGAWDIRDRLASLEIPTLLVQGLGTQRQDSSVAVVWRAATREWTEKAPHSGVVFLDAPAQFPWIGASDYDRVASVFLGGGWPAEARAPHLRMSSR